MLLEMGDRWDGWPPNLLYYMFVFFSIFSERQQTMPPISARYDGWLSADVAGLFSLVHIRYLTKILLHLTLNLFDGS
jgi:hypothetical protein